MWAERLRFRERPEAEVRFTGSPGRESVSRTARLNLPEPVVPEADDDDVRVDYLLSTRLPGAPPETG